MGIFTRVNEKITFQQQPFFLSKKENEFPDLFDSLEQLHPSKLSYFFQKTQGCGCWFLLPSPIKLLGTIK